LSFFDWSQPLSVETTLPRRADELDRDDRIICTKVSDSRERENASPERIRRTCLEARRTKRQSLEMSWDEKVVVIFYALLGAFLAVLIFFFALGGIDLLTGKSTAWWNGWTGLFLAACCGAIVGGFSYKFRDREFTAPEVDPYGGQAGAQLLIRRGGVILMAIIAVYYLWQQAKSI